MTWTIICSAGYCLIRLCIINARETGLILVLNTDLHRTESYTGRDTTLSNTYWEGTNSAWVRGSSPFGATHTLNVCCHGNARLPGERAAVVIAAFSLGFVLLLKRWGRLRRAQLYNLQLIQFVKVELESELLLIVTSFALSKWQTSVFSFVLLWHIRYILKLLSCTRSSRESKCCQPN